MRAIMATRTVFEDVAGNELECYLNNALQVFISVGPKDDESGYAGSFIVLDRDDVGKLIEFCKTRNRLWMPKKTNNQILFPQHPIL
jgi:hypothetical protein